MKGGKWSVGVLVFVFFLAVLVLGGCGGSGGASSVVDPGLGPRPGPEPQPNPLPQPAPNPIPQPSPQPKPKPHPDAGALNKWNGTWKSFGDFVDEEAMVPVWGEIASFAPGHTPNGAKAFFRAMYGTRFGSLKVDGNTIAYLDGKGAVMGTVAYEFTGTRKRRLERAGRSVEVEWHLFEASGGGGAASNAGSPFLPERDCRFLALTLVTEEGEEDEGLYWHMRYGGANLDGLIDDLGALWLPKLCTPDTTVADAARGQLSKARTLAGMLPKPLSEWNGEWISAAMLHRTPPMLPAYQRIADEAVKLGKNYTSDDVKAYYRARYDTPFWSVIVTDGITVRYRRKDGTFVTAVYGDGGSASDDWLIWNNLTWFDGAGPGYRTVVATPPRGHGADRQWSMRYTDDKRAEELMQIQNWTPTFYNPALMTPEGYAEIFIESAESKAKSLPAK